jgi:surface polysaccharide O-acyltransferase-like enzyme
MENYNIRERYVFFDILKVIAVCFVIILHLNGYTMQMFGIDSYVASARVEYYFLEALAYPAIHIFVLIGSFFIIGKKTSLKMVRHIYVQLYTVTIIGLILSLILIRSDVAIGGVLQSVFPFSQRAYWFVSDYIVLVLVSPFLSIIVDKAPNKQLQCLTALLMFLSCLCLIGE